MTMAHTMDASPAATGHHHDGEFSADCEACYDEHFAERVAVYVRAGQPRRNAEQNARDDWRDLVSPNWNEITDDDA